jgi:2-phosphoglycerate kinase
MDRKKLETILLFMGVKPWNMDKTVKEIELFLDKKLEFPETISHEAFQIASSIIEREANIIILVGGTSGSGKSTLATLLASRLGVTTVVSTDHIRQVLRSTHDINIHPLLFTSSYNHDVSVVLENYEIQCEYILNSLITIIQKKFQLKKESIIIEGVHLSCKNIKRLMERFDNCIPFLLYISNETKHMERFAIRSKYMTLEPRANRYAHHFSSIRLIQNYLVGNADKIPMVDNTNVDRSLAFIHDVLQKYLTHQNYPSLDILYESYSISRDKFFKSSKEMLKTIREKRHEKQEDYDYGSHYGIQFLGSLGS